MARSTVALLVAVTLVVLGIPARPAHPAERDVPDPLAQPGGYVLLGAQVVADQPGLHAWRDATAALETRLGRELDLSWHTRPWVRGLPRRRLSDDLSAGRIPVVAWTDLDTAAMAAGDADRTLDRFARTLAASEKPILLAPLPPDALEGEEAAARYVSAFRRLDARLERAGAGNVGLVWCPAAPQFGEPDLRRWYPGEDHVDWACASGTPSVPTPDAAGDAFAAFHRWAEGAGHPVLLALGGGAAAAAAVVDAAAAGRRTPEGTGLDALVLLDAAGGAGGQGGSEDLAELAQDPRLRPPQRATGPLGVAEGVLFGAHAKDTREYRPEDAQRATVELEEALGRRLDIAHSFYPWDKPFPTEFERWSIAGGRIPMISWNGTDVATINAGREDAWIRERAAAVAALDAPVLLRWFWEMDGNRKADWARDPEQYTAAWRRIRDLFAEQGADQVAWVWCPNAAAFDTGTAAEWYPGAEAVDWVCADGYNMAGAQEGAQDRSLYQIFSRFYAWAREQDKPIMIGETGAVEREPGQKAAWQAEAAEDLPAWLPDVQAYVHFDAVNHELARDWRVDTSRSALEAFREMARDPYFDPRGAVAASGR